MKNDLKDVIKKTLAKEKRHNKKQKFMLKKVTSFCEDDDTSFGNDSSSCIDTPIERLDQND